MLATEDDLRNWLTATEVGATPKHLGIRLDEAGNFLPIAGNTVIRHVTKGSRSMEMLVSVQERLKQAEFGAHFAYLPPASFHMTVFEGVVHDRRRPDAWPEGVALDRPVADTTALYLDRLSGFTAPQFTMRGAGVSPLGLLVEGATQQDERGARHLREQFTVPFGYRQHVHDAYRFHITLAYVRRLLPDEAIGYYMTLCSELSAMVQAFGPLELERPAFCTFADLTHFEEALPL
jgi:hypothetical protein